MTKMNILIKSLIDEPKKYIPEIDYNTEIVKLYFDDGSTAKFDFDEWFKLLDLAHHICKINDELCREDDK